MTIESSLLALGEDAIWSVNAALEDGREDLAQALSDSYLDDALELLAGRPGSVLH